MAQRGTTRHSWQRAVRRHYIVCNDVITSEIACLHNSQPSYIPVQPLPNSLEKMLQYPKVSDRTTNGVLYSPSCLHFAVRLAADCSLERLWDSAGASFPGLGSPQGLCAHSAQVSIPEHLLIFCELFTWIKRQSLRWPRQLPRQSALQLVQDTDHVLLLSLLIRLEAQSLLLPKIRNPPFFAGKAKALCTTEPVR